MSEKTVIVMEGENHIVEIPFGTDCLFSINRPYKFLIETSGGTVIAGRATPAAPLNVKPMPDIKVFKIIFDEESTVPLHLVHKEVDDSEKG